MKFSIFVTCFVGAAFLINLWVTVRLYRLEQLKKAAAWTSQPYADAVREATKGAAGNQDLIHRPPGGDCPAGYTLEPKAFSRGAETWDGCRKQGSNHPGHYSIDVILPQETVNLVIVVPPELFEPPDRKGRV